MQTTFKITGKVPADGPQTIDLSGYKRVLRKQIQIVSESSATGSVAIAVRTPGAAGYMTILTIDITTGPVIVPLTEHYCDSIQFTLTSDTAAKAFDIYVFCLQG